MSRQSSARPRAEHLGPTARRPLVLDAALVVWSQHGYRGTTMTAVADEAAVSKPVVYECFATKDEMLLALLDREERRLVSAAVSALPDLPGLPHEDLARSYAAFFAAVTEHPLSWRVVFDAQRSVPSQVGERYRAGRRAVVEQVATLLQLSDLRTASMGAAELTLVAGHCVALAEQAAGLLLDPSEHAWAPEALAETLADLVLEGIGSRGSTPVRDASP